MYCKQEPCKFNYNLKYIILFKFFRKNKQYIKKKI